MHDPPQRHSSRVGRLLFAIIAASIFGYVFVRDAAPQVHSAGAVDTGDVTQASLVFPVMRAADDARKEASRRPDDLGEKVAVPRPSSAVRGSSTPDLGEIARPTTEANPSDAVRDAAEVAAPLSWSSSEASETLLAAAFAAPPVPPPPAAGGGAAADAPHTGPAMSLCDCQVQELGENDGHWAAADRWVWHDDALQRAVTAHESGGRDGEDEAGEGDGSAARTMLRAFVSRAVRERRAAHGESTTAPRSARRRSDAVRILFIGDSIIRGLFAAFVREAASSGYTTPLDGRVPGVERNVSESIDQLRLFHVTWPFFGTDAQSACLDATVEGGGSGGGAVPECAASGAPPARVSELYLRFEWEPYFSGNYPFLATGAAAFAPTHVVITRGAWDLGQRHPLDPVVAMRELGAGLVKARRTFGGAVRIFYLAMPHLVARGGSRDWRTCVRKHYTPVFRTALRCALKHANTFGAEVEPLNFLQLTRQAGIDRTTRRDGVHYTLPVLRAQMHFLLHRMMTAQSSEEALRTFPHFGIPDGGQPSGVCALARVAPGDEVPASLAVPLLRAVSSPKRCSRPPLSLRKFDREAVAARALQLLDAHAVGAAGFRARVAAACACAAFSLQLSYALGDITSAIAKLRMRLPSHSGHEMPAPPAAAAAHRFAATASRCSAFLTHNLTQSVLDGGEGGGGGGGGGSGVGLWKVASDNQVTCQEAASGAVYRTDAAPAPLYVPLPSFATCVSRHSDSAIHQRRRDERRGRERFTPGAEARRPARDTRAQARPRTARKRIGTEEE